MGRKMERSIETIDLRLLALRERYGTWAAVADKLKVTERSIANWTTNGVPAGQNKRVNDLLAGKAIKARKK